MKTLTLSEKEERILKDAIDTQILELQYANETYDDSYDIGSPINNKNTISALLKISTKISMTVPESLDLQKDLKAEPDTQIADPDELEITFTTKE